MSSTATNNVHPTPSHESWPPERFYWSILDCPGRVVPLSGTLLLLMEDDLPIDVEALHAVGVRLDERRVLACAATKEDLAALDATIDSGVVTLSPSAIPEGVPGGASIDPRALNLLTQGFEPASLRRERRAQGMLLAGTLLLLTLVAALGLWRRAAAWNEVALALDARAHQLLASTVPSEPGRSAKELESLLQNELTRLRQTRWAAASGADPREGDAADALAGYLALWPRPSPDGHALRVRTEFLSVTPTSIALALRTANEVNSDAGESISTEPTALVAKLPRPPGWIMDEPRLTVREGNASLAVQLRRESSGGQGGTP